MNEQRSTDLTEVSTSVTFLGEFSKKLITNTFFNLLGRFWNFLVTLLLTPYILSHLGVGDFGVWVLLTVLITSFNLLDLGLGSSFVKYISEYYTLRDYERINRVIFSGLVFYALFGALLTMAGLALERPLFRVFRISDASDVYLVLLVTFCLLNITHMFLSVLKGIQRMDKSNAVEVKMSIPSVLGTIIFLESGTGMLGLTVNGLIHSVVMAGLAWWTVKRLVPEISLGWHFDRELLRNMFGYGAKIQVSRLGGLVCFQLDKLIISRFIGTAAVSFYEVSSRLASFMRAVPLVMISALIPATSELGARNDREKILKTYLMVSKYVAMVTVALVAYVVLEARTALNLWLGQGFEQSIILVQILAIGYGVNVLGGAASQTGAGVGKPEFDMRSTIVLAVLNPILSLSLVREFGAAGAAAGTSLAMSLAAAYLLIIFHRNYVANSAWVIARDIHLRSVIAGIVASLGVVGFHRAFPQILALETVRIMSPLKLVADFAVFAPIYVVLLIALRQVTAIDWKNFLGLLSFGFEFVRHPFRERVKTYR